MDQCFRTFLCQRSPFILFLGVGVFVVLPIWKSFVSSSIIKESILGYAPETQEASGASVSAQKFFSGSKGSTSLGGKASLQPKRTPVSNEEIEAILVCKTLLFLEEFPALFFSNELC